MKRFGVILAGLAGCVVLSLLLGLVRPFGNPRATTTVATDSPSTLLLEHALIPVEVRSVLRAKCADCHSTQTQWPWYARLAPGSWLMERDITEARAQMDLSQWESLSTEDIVALSAEIAGVTRAGAMSPWRYAILHHALSVTDDDVRLLKGWSHGRTPRPPGTAEKTPANTRAGDAEHGKEVFASRCAGCHSLDRHQEGPKLAGLFARKSGTAPGFLYSAALKQAAVQWDEKALDTWLTEPNSVASMNNMHFDVANAEQRRNLIAYLKAVGGRARPPVRTSPPR